MKTRQKASRLKFDGTRAQKYILLKTGAIPFLNGTYI